ncbi:Fe-S cluster assembly sulfur transfer protein SufU [Rubrobacter radiotolerans]|nr:SUF system NifU family Fe-S cluster assembly protein [Rubrobacter radiotolerans]MDX5892649.1 SUF system NifU family Fe-S cluster assembly protein [Rubrobacter radiotolerans]SMC08019.1 nitrogen fixation protein NifU [Rubrobacter radiotolerans DSM 5868]
MEGLYREILLDHFEHPRGRGEMPEAEIVEHLLNPLCGDEVTVYARNDEPPSEVTFTGRGCTISQASASMMTERLSGMSPGEQAAEIERFIAMMRGGEPDESLGELVALKHIVTAPNRIRCATLAWEALRKGLEKE